MFFQELESHWSLFHRKERESLVNNRNLILGELFLYGVSNILLVLHIDTQALARLTDNGSSESLSSGFGTSSRSINP